MQGKAKLLSLHTIPPGGRRPSFSPHLVHAATSAGAKGKRAIPVMTHQSIRISRLLFMEPSQ